MILIINDTHLHENNIELHADIWKQVRQICSERRIKTIIHAGDWLVSRKAQSQIILNCLEDEIDKCYEEGLEIYSIPGNHDKTDYKSKRSFLDSYRHFPNFHLFSEPSSMTIDSKNFVFCPYFDESDKMKEMIKESVKHNDNAILITHCSFQNFDSQDKEAKYYIKHEDVKDFNLVVSGHIHNEWKYKNIIHHPSPYQANFGENEKKGVSILHDDLSLEFIQLDFPKFHTVKGVSNLNNLSKLEGSKRAIVSVDAEELEKLRQKYPDVKIENERVTTVDLKTESVSQARGKTAEDHLEDYCNQKNKDFKRLKNYF